MSIIERVNAVATQAKTPIESLIAKEDETLLGMLADRATVTAVRPSLSASYNPIVTEGYGTRADEQATDRAALGTRIFRRWNVALHDFFCGSNITSDDKELRDIVFSTLKISKDAAAPLIAGILVTAFGASPATAAVVAALLYKCILQPAGTELCASWGAYLHSK